MTPGRVLGGFSLAPLLPSALWAISPQGFNIIAFAQTLPWAYALTAAAGVPAWLLLRALRRHTVLMVMALGAGATALVGTAFHAWDLRRASWVRQRQVDLVVDGQFTSEGLAAVAMHGASLLVLGAIGALVWWWVTRSSRRTAGAETSRSQPGSSRG
ncbi:MAG: hypothetical protein JJU27_02200 [Gammaproteobacteria bacterium]|nr:hypothetical protein [Gammaproteobacteria bacterium]